ncbi:MAG: RNA polymerase sigma factor [Thermoleophilia bacterium]
MTDAELIIASRGDPAVFGELYRRHAEALLAYLYRRTFDAEVSADLLAETFAVAFAKRARFRDTGTPGAAWLYGIAARELSHWYRRRRVELRAAKRMGLDVPTLDDESIERIERLEETAQGRAAVRDALADLPTGERDAVHLRVVCELAYREVADRLGCTENAARTRVHRGLARLSRALEVTP